MPRTARTRYAPRDIDADGAERAIATAREAGLDLSVAGLEALFGIVGAAAPSVLPLLLADPAHTRALARELSTRATIAPASAPPPTASAGLDDDATKHAIRRMRNAAFVRTALRELFALADVDRTAREWSQVAAACTAHALSAARARVDARYGPARDETGATVPFAVLGMGKLSGDELNLGSDIDICFFYGTDDGAAGDRSLHEYFALVSTTLTALLADVTGDGFAFRVDLRLRPEGASGPIANSLSSAERYYETWGRSWERAAMLRSRPVAGDVAFGTELMAALHPFVWRRSVDPAIARDVAAMLDRARREMLRDDTRDLKLGRGGIREAEFFVQALQLVWGGRHPTLQVPGTLHAVARLRALGLLTHREASAFGDAWALLRRTEHRVQVMAGYATHLLPPTGPAQRALARSLGYAGFESLSAALGTARATIRGLFATLTPREDGSAAGSVPPASPETVLADLVAQQAPRESVASHARDVLGVRDPDSAADELARLARRADLPLGAVAHDRWPQLGPRLLAEVRDAPDPDRALAHLADVFSRLRGADRYARELAESPTRARGLVGLFGASETLSRSLVARPDLLDAVVAGGGDVPDPAAIALRVTSAVDEAVARARASGDDVLDIATGALRRVQRELTLEVGVADMAGVITPGEVARRLSALAEAALVRAFVLAADEAAERFGTREGARDPLDGIAVFAMGSLAARELGYGGDVDAIVLYDRESETRGGRRAGVGMAEYAARIAQRAIFVLSSMHPEGPGFTIDTRLRPSGSQGTLVVSLDAFTRYHARGEAHSSASAPGRAGSWERQALIRSRFGAGDAVFGELATRRIEEAAYEQGAPDLAELLRLRERMERELAPARTTDIVSLKYGRGALVDVEFAAQALQMTHGRDTRVRTPTTRRALVALRDLGLIDPVVADDLAAGERLLRRALLASRLIAGRSSLEPGTPAAATIARKLGYRHRAERSAEEELFAELLHVRERVRAAFVAVTTALGAPR